MRRFLASAWFPFLVSVVLAAGAVTAYALLKPTGEDVGNDQLVRIFSIAGWAAGPVMGLLSLFLAMTLNGIRRIVRLRGVEFLHPAVTLLGVLPWLILSWQITGEPRFTAFARAAIDFVARPMLWGSLIAVALTLLLSLVLVFPEKK